MGTDKRSGSKKKSYHHGDLRAALVSAGAELLEEVGVEKLSLRAVARAAGVSQAAPYHHFANKEALVAAIAADAFQRLSADLAALADGAEGPLDLLRRMGRFYVGLARERPHTVQLVAGRAGGVPGDSPQLAHSVDQLLDFIRLPARELLGDRPEQVATLTVGSWAVVHGLAQLLAGGWVRSDGFANDEALVDAVIEVWARGILSLLAEGAGP